MTRTVLFWKAKLSLFVLFIGLMMPVLGFSESSWTKTNNETSNVSPPVNCSALIMPGTITGNQSVCGTSIDPTVISNVTLGSSPEGPVHYLWMYRNATTGYVWTSTGVMTDSIDPGVITETTEYTRCVGLIGCSTFPSETNIITIDVFPPFNPGVVVSSDITCSGFADGSASIAVTGGGGPGSYFYQWDNGATTAAISGLAAGTYSVTVTDTNGCTTSGSATIAEPTALSEVTTSMDVTCNNAGDGSAMIVVSGGTAPYSYLWSDGQTMATASSLDGGSYSVTVTDANGCVITQSITVGEPVALTASSTSTPLSCNTSNNATIDVTVAGGTAPYTFMWDNGATTEDLSALANGTYSLTVTDANGCSTVETFVIASSPINCCNLVTPGTIAASQANCGPFTPNTITNLSSGQNLSGAPVNDVEYVWMYRDATTGGNFVLFNGGVTTDSLQPGMITITTEFIRCVRNVGCITYPGETNIVTITIYPVPTASVVSTDITCNGAADGTATVTVSGGTTPYTYSWSNGATTAMISGLAAGTYTVTATDANGCTATGSATIAEPTALAEVTTSTDVSCNAGSDGTAMFAVSGGTMPYTYSWSNGATTASISGLVAGVYTVTATDANGCAISGSVTITEPNPLAGSINILENVSCNGGSDGSIYANIVGGTGTITFEWVAVNATTGVPLTGIVISTNDTLSGVPAGTYGVTYTDANGCSAFNTNHVISEPTALTEMTTSTNVSCNAGADGTAMFAVAGGTAPYTYAWSDGQTTASATGLAAGTYTVVATDANGCTISGSATITEPTALSEVTTSTNVTCNDYNDGTAMIVVSGGTAPYTYSWSNGETIASVTGLENGTYTVTATDANGCTISQTVIITQPLSLSEVTTSTDVSCNAGTDGTAMVVISGGTAPYTYSWSNGATTASVTGLAAGSYTVTATDANGCMIYGFATITEPTALAEVTSSTDVSCNAGTDGTAMISVSGGTMPYTYSWSNGATAASISGLVAGTYTVTATDANGCAISGSTTIGEPTALAEMTSSTDVSCNAGTDGTAMTVVSGGTAPYTYSWSNGATTASITGLTAGTYTVTVTDGNGCMISGSTTVTEPTALAETTTSTDVSCNAGTDGTAMTVVTGGTMPYTYSWSNGATTASIAGLVAGTYTVNVTDANGCMISGTVTIVEPTALAQTTTSTDVTCNAGTDGTAMIAVSGGTMPYTYSWSNGATSASITGLVAGTYTVTVTDANGCVISGSATITEPTALTELTTSTDVSCYAGTDGTAMITVSGGTMPYTYSWSNGATTASISGLVAGTYTVTVTDANGCVISGSATIVEPSQLLGNKSGTNVSCNGGSDGTASIMVLGGTMPYTYLWNDGAAQTTATATGLIAGLYTVVVTDANGCTLTKTVTITEPTPLSEMTSSTNVSCNAGTDGTAMTVVSGGTMPYTYSWSNGATTASISGLAAGTYTVTATDANGCMISGSTTITEPTALSEMTSSTDVSCNGGADGTAMIVVSGGTAPYTYLWSDGQTTASATGLAAGTYTVVATDANGCMISGIATVAEPTALAEVTSSTDVSCNSGADGTAMTVVSGGTAPYTYSWSNGATTASIAGLTAGTYTVTVTDANGCMISGSTTVAEPTALSEMTSSTDVSCNGGADGTAMIVVSGGTAPFTYLWSNQMMTSSISGLVAGTYTVTVTDANGCIISSIVTVAEPTALAQTTTSTNVSCNAGTDGTATIAVSGGTMPYTYLWSDGQTTASATGLAAGTYTVVVTDANGCMISGSATITEPTALAEMTSSTNVSCNAGTDGTAMTVISGGTMPYTYSWSNGATTASVSGLAAGTYTVTVTDANGCMISGSATITEPTALAEMTVSSNVSCHGGSDGTASAMISGGTAPYTYDWSNGGTTATISGLSAGSYALTVTDANGCIINAVVSIMQPTMLAGTMSSVDVTCNGSSDGSATVVTTGGTPAYTYLWSDGQTTATATGLAAGSYSVTITDANGCTITESVMVSEPTLLTSVSSSIDVSCHSYVDGSATITVAGGTMPYTYLWSDGQTTATAIDLGAGTYTVTATDANGCTTMQTIVITEPIEFHSVATSVDASCFNSCDGTAIAVETGGVMPYTYLWSNGATTATVAGLCAGSYTMIAQDANNCLASASVVIGEPAEIAVTFATSSATSNIFATAANGSLPYTWLWSTGSTSSLLTGAVDGQTYSVTVTDANGCTKTDSIVYNDGVNQFVINVGPNPFSQTTTMKVSTQVSTDISVDIYDAQGNVVENSYNGHLESGTILELTLDGNNLEGGLYFCRVVSSEGMSTSKKIFFVK